MKINKFNENVESVTTTKNDEHVSYKIEIKNSDGVIIFKSDLNELKYVINIYDSVTRNKKENYLYYITKTTQKILTAEDIDFEREQIKYKI